jgi:hypothetical protein
MFRIRSTQKDNVETTSVTAGRTAWYKALPTKAHVHPILTEVLYAPEIGNQCNTLLNRNKATSPNQKYGIEEKNVVTGNKLSKIDPGFHPTTHPITVPHTKLRTVHAPTKTKVHGRLEPITSVTGVGKYVNETPKSP